MTAPLLLTSGRVQHAEPSPADNAVQALSLNADGRLRVASKQAVYGTLTGNINLLNMAVPVDVAEASNVMCHVKNVGTATMAAGEFVFEGSLDSSNGSDGTWFELQAVRSNGNVVESNTGVLGLSPGNGPLYSWELSVNAIKWFRIRVAVALSNDAMANWTILPGSYATEPIPATQRHAVDVMGTVPVSLADIPGALDVAGIASPVAVSGITDPVSIAGTVPVSAPGNLPVAVQGTVPVSGSVTANNPTNSAGLNVSTASTNAGVIKGSAGSLAEITAFNPTAAVIYVKLYNKATAPTVGTDVPILTFSVPVNGTVAHSFGSVGKRFSAGIAIAMTAGPLATDTAVIAAGAVVSSTYI